MAKSKRDKQVSLTKVKKKTKERKKALVADIKSCVEIYRNLFVFTVENMRTTKFIKVRQKFKSNSRFFFGKNNVMAIALGRNSALEYAKGLSKVSEVLKGSCGLMFTNEDADATIKFFTEYKEADFPRSGEEVKKTVEIPKGSLSQFPFSMEPQLRKLGVPTKLDKGCVTLVSDFSICKKGDTLTSEQAKILKLFGEEVSQFKVKLIALWNKTDGFKNLSSGSNAM